MSLKQYWATLFGMLQSSCVTVRMLTLRWPLIARFSRRNKEKPPGDNSEEYGTCSIAVI